MKKLEWEKYGENGYRIIFPCRLIISVYRERELWRGYVNQAFIDSSRELEIVKDVLIQQAQIEMEESLKLIHAHWSACQEELDEMKPKNLLRLADKKANVPYSILEAVDNAKNAILNNEGAFKGDKILIVALDEASDKYNIGVIAGNLKSSEVLSLVEVLKTKVLSWMGYLPKE